ncbi:MAG: ATP-dependent DNA ligase [Bacteroidota bacterium]|nr:ATP-dependent DNA ligase [Bacteroidota bacterium]
MKLFAEFIVSLDRTNKTNDKIEIIKNYFANTNENDKLWTLYLLSGGKLKKKFNTSQLRDWAIEFSLLPKWLFEESYHSVGDLAETIALILPEPLNSSNKTLTEWIYFIEAVNNANDENRKEKIIESWNSLDQNERFVFNKLITGSFRVGVSQKTVINALSKTEDLEANVIAHRLMGNWHPSRTTFSDLLNSKNVNDEISKPYPFYLAYSIEDNPESLGDPADWQAEWKWDGIRGQLIYRQGELFLWSRGEELVTDKFPELQTSRSILPDGIVLDGEIMCYGNNCPLPFNLLQTRIGRKNINQKVLAEAPVVFMIYDILEYESKDIRQKSLMERREIISNFKSDISNWNCFKISPTIEFDNWEELRKVRVQARDLFTEGIMLKRKSSEYQVGRKKGDWWKWKIDPHTIDAVMIYAQKGHGRRADLFTDYTFAVWDNDKLVSFTKAYSGLTDKEIKEVDAFVKRNTVEKFGPVRTVKPELVFEIAFEGIAPSGRHKSGVALRFPRILRWRRDKKIQDADTLENLKKLLTNE